MLPLLGAHLCERWSELKLPGPPPARVSFVVQGTGVTKVCAYAYAADPARPVCVVKMARGPADNGAMEREYAMVADLRARGCEAVRRSVPAPLAVERFGALVVAIERYLGGQPVDGLLAGAGDATDVRVQRCVSLALDWLIRAQRETTCGSQRLCEAQLETQFFAPIAELRRHGLLDDERTYLDRLEQRIKALADRPLPLVFHHGDFQPKNLLIEDDALNVIDWEFGESTALPLLDVFGFLARVDARLRGLEEIDGTLDDYRGSFRAVFGREGAQATATARHVGQAAEALGVDRDWLGILFAMSLVTEANKYRRFLEARAARSYLYLMRLPDEGVAPYSERLRRQKNVWLLGELARAEGAWLFPLGATGT